MMKEKMIVNDILCLFSCFFLMGCNAIKEDNTKVYVDSYSQTALQQADIIMDGIQSENCEEIADIFCTYIKKNCNLLEYLTQRDIQTKNSGVNVRYRGKHRFFKGFNEFIKEKTRRCDNDFEKIERHVFF